MSLSTELKETIQQWSDHKLRERPFIALEFLNKEPQDKAEDDKEVPAKEEVELTEEMQLEIQKKNYESYIAYSLKKINILLEILGLEDDTKLQVFYEIENNGIKEMNKITDTLFERTLENIDTETLENINFGDCSFSNVISLIQGCVKSEFPSVFETDEEYERETISYKFLIHIPGKKLALHVYDGRGGTLVSVDNNTQSLAYIHNTIGKTDTSLFNPYWIKKSIGSIMNLSDEELDKLAESGIPQTDFRFVLELIKSEAGLQCNMNFQDANPLREGSNWTVHHTDLDPTKEDITSPEFNSLISGFNITDYIGEVVDKYYVIFEQK